jgi:hypothetical protein
MITLTPYVDPDHHTATGPTTFMTERNEHEVRCGMCARPVYVDDETFRLGSEAVESGLDNPYRCEICEVEYDDLVYEG